MHPVLFIDAIMVKVRDGQVTNRPVHVAIEVTVHGERDILGLWAGDGGEGVTAVSSTSINMPLEPHGRGIRQAHRRLCRIRR